MFINRKTQSGRTVKFVVPYGTEERLRNTCYRGPSQRLAGNFMKFNSSDDLLRDEVVLQELLAETEVLWSRGRLGTWGFTLTCANFIGWESTDPLSNYKKDDLLRFEPNRQSRGLRVRSGRQDLRAPKTKDITIVFDLQGENGNPVVVIHSVYPGTDIGRLTGNVTEREGRVFFDWNHPSEE